MTDDIKFDLSAMVIFIQMMMSLEDSKIGIQNSDVRNTLIEIGSMLERDNIKELETKGPKVITMLSKLVDYFLKKSPPKIPWQQIAADFSQLCKQDKQIYSFGINHGWLYKRMDCSGYGFAELPLNARIGIGHHAGRASLVDSFLLDDAFFFFGGG